MFDANLKQTKQNKKKNCKHAGRANFRGSGEGKNKAKSKAIKSSGAVRSAEHVLKMSIQDFRIIYIIILKTCCDVAWCFALKS